MSKNKQEEEAQVQTTETHTSTAVPPAKGGDVITLTADTREQLQEDSLKYLADNPGAYALGATGYCAEIGKYTIKIKTKEEK